MKSLKIALVVMVAVLFVVVVAVRAEEAAKPKAGDVAKTEVKAEKAAEKADAKENVEARKEAVKEAAAAPAEPVDKAKLAAEVKATEAEAKEAKAGEKQDKEDMKADKGQEVGKKDIAETVAAHGQYKTLDKALADAGLTATLKGKGPMTLLAPNDEAFAKMPAKELDALLKDKAKLAEVLKKHIIDGKVMPADIAKMKEIKTLGGTVAVSEKEKVVSVGAAKLGKETEASNGLIIAVDAVVTK